MPLKSLSEYESLAAQAHGHLCAGQILGLRMAICGLHELGLEDPTGGDRRRLVTIVEIDRCATDAIGVVTGCRPGKRTLKLRDFGKMAATFCDIQENRAVRVVALESSRLRAREQYPDLEKGEQQIRAYRELPDSDLFSVSRVRVNFQAGDLPGFKASAVICGACGEAVGLRREVLRDGVFLCRACAGERYYEPEE